MALTQHAADKMHAFVQRMIKDNGIDATVTATTDRREALEGADYVVVMIQVGGVDEFRQDYEIPLKYGVDQCIGDTLGPGGVFRALRHIPALLEIAARHAGALPERASCSTTPTRWRCAAGRWAACRACSSSACATACRPLDLIASYAGVPKERDRFPGRRHQPHGLVPEAGDTGGRDLYPLLKAQLREARVLRQREGPRRGACATSATS